MKQILSRTTPVPLLADANRAYRRAAARRLRGPSTFFVMLMLAGASHAEHAPAVEITGSYFPSWMLFLVFGIVGSVLLRGVLIRIGIDDYMPFRVISYTALALLITFALLLFGARLL